MATLIEQSTQKKKIHPHKFALWVGMASITMMFAGLTSAYMVREAQGNWVIFKLPFIFWPSTIVIIISSVTVFLGQKAYKKRNMAKYKSYITTTVLLGIAFGIMQYIGFKQLYGSNIKLTGNPSESFLFIITGMHLLHLAGGIIALLFVFFGAYRTKVKNYNSTGLDIVASYWHFVDVLWIYLFVFFLANQ